MTPNDSTQKSDGSDKSQVVVAVVPFAAQGHLNQLLHLSRLISSCHVPVHFVGSATHTKQATSRNHGWDPLAATNLHFHEFPIPHFTTPPPDPNSNASTNFPTHLQPSFDAYMALRQPVMALLRGLALTTHRLVIIFDSLMGSVVEDSFTITNAEAYSFQSSSAFVHLTFTWLSAGSPALPGLEIPSNLPSFDGCFSQEFFDLAMSQFKIMENKSVGVIHNVSKVIEGKHFDLIIELTQNNNQWALGPFNPVHASDQLHHRCLTWLNDQPSNSVIYVSFGTTTVLSVEQIHELAIGLEKSEGKFIWVLREADKGDIFEGTSTPSSSYQLPEGYEERIKGKGIITREWVPQLNILGHPSTGGFMSHCGWNSCMESISMGVPIVAWPMHSDQPRNAMLVTDVLKIGVAVRDWGMRDEVVTSSSIDKVVRTLMASKQGDEIRTRAQLLGGAVRTSVADGGVANAELHSFISHITRS